jgi:uncharacterized protein (TIGR00375 family)
MEDKKNWMISDLHIHSRFSRACSKSINFDNLVKWAKVKGLNLLGTSDFTHPIWFEEIKKNLIEKNGLYYYEDFPFIISGEVSLIYTHKEKGRKVHLNLLIPSLEVAESINNYLDNKKFRRDYDGRPIFGISCEDFTRDMMNISREIEIIPAHIWTPYFGVFGSMSGFSSLEEAFGSQIEYIHSIETGISSDREMNNKIKEFSNRNISILSFSDSHSFWPWRLGREATIFKKVNSFPEIINQIRENNFIGTIETDPAYGKYHWDGHASCDFSCSPEESKKLNNICPKCNKSLRIGVENRVKELSDELNIETKIEFKILPLHEIISLHKGVGLNSKTVWNIYNSLIEQFENELNILLNVSKEDFVKMEVDEKLINLILRNREGKIKVKPGYDGVYGQALMGEKQSTLI